MRLLVIPVISILLCGTAEASNLAKISSENRLWLYEKGTRIEVKGSVEVFLDVSSMKTNKSPFTGEDIYIIDVVKNISNITEPEVMSELRSQRFKVAVSCEENSYSTFMVDNYATPGGKGRGLFVSWADQFTQLMSDQIPFDMNKDSLSCSLHRLYCRKNTSAC